MEFLVGHFGVDRVWSKDNGAHYIRCIIKFPPKSPVCITLQIAGKIIKFRVFGCNIFTTWKWGIIIINSVKICSVYLMRFKVYKINFWDKIDQMELHQMKLKWFDEIPFDQFYLKKGMRPPSCKCCCWLPPRPEPRGSGSSGFLVASATPIEFLRTQIQFVRWRPHFEV